MPGQQQQQESGTRAVFNGLYVTATGFAWTLIPFCHWNMGTEAIGIRGVVAMVAIWVYCAFARCPHMVTFFWCWLAAIVVQRVRSMILANRGVAIHTRYPGDPIMMKLFPCIQRVGTAQGIQVLLWLIAGCAVTKVSESFGHFIIFGALAMFFVFVIDEHIMKRRVRAIGDMEIEQWAVQDAYRRSRTGR